MCVGVKDKKYRIVLHVHVVKYFFSLTGETNIEKIMTNVNKAIGSKCPLYCLGFGYDVNFDFLTKMSLENSGAARRIYEDSDADLQLQVDYRESAGNSSCFGV